MLVLKQIMIIKLYNLLIKIMSKCLLFYEKSMTLITNIFRLFVEFLNIRTLSQYFAFFFNIWHSFTIFSTLSQLLAHFLVLFFVKKPILINIWILIISGSNGPDLSDDGRPKRPRYTSTCLMDDSSDHFHQLETFSVYLNSPTHLPIVQYILCHATQLIKFAFNQVSRVSD